MKKNKVIKICFLSLFNPLSLFSLYVNLGGRDMNPTNNYKFVLSFETIFYNYLVPSILFLISAFIYELIILKIQNKGSGLFLNYIFSSIFMWFLVYLVGFLRQS